MSFIQIIDFHTTDLESIKKSHENWLAATEGKRTIRRDILARDRNDPTHYIVLAFFDSYESAMENSALPGTQASAEEFAAAADGDMTFVDLDVVIDD